jgi:hypothetical protein
MIYLPSNGVRRIGRYISWPPNTVSSFYPEEQRVMDIKQKRSSVTSRRRNYVAFDPDSVATHFTWPPASTPCVVFLAAGGNMVREQHCCRQNLYDRHQVHVLLN